MIRYAVLEDHIPHFPTYEDGYEFDARSIYDLTKTIIDDYIVSEMGRDYHHNHDGWDNRDWPGNNLTFRVWSDENNFEDYSVLLEYDPVFYARKIF